MKRREMLLSLGAIAGASLLPANILRAAEKKAKILYFTRSAGFEHSAVKRNGDSLSFSETTLIEMGKKGGFEVVCSKDGRVFDGDLDEYDALAFYTSGDLTKPNERKTPPISVEGKSRLLDAVAAGKPFIGFHAATDTWRGGETPDPYIKMIGGEFIGHGTQQKVPMEVVSPKFPGLKGIDTFSMLEEWYAFKNFADDLHVILVQDTEAMSKKHEADKRLYDRPPFPATWARMHENGRVFYTSMGHREDVWTSPTFQQIVLGGIDWALGRLDADVTPNIAKVTPGAAQLSR
jgi:uncharacterized protein